MGYKASHICDLDRQWATSSSAEYPRRWEITGSGDNIAICPHIVVVPNTKQAYASSYTIHIPWHGLYRQATALPLNKTTSGLFPCDQLPHTVVIHTMGFIMRGSNKSLYMVLLSAVDGKTLLLPVRFRHVENSLTRFPMLLYTPLRRITFKAITTLRAIFIAIHICSDKIRFFSDFQKFTL